MYELVIVVISLCAVFASASMYRKASGEPVFKLNMLNYSFWVLTLTAFCGATLAVVAQTIPGIVDGDHFGDQANRFAVWLMVLWALLGLPAGAVACNFVFGIHGLRQRAQKFRDSIAKPGWLLSDDMLFRIVVISSIILVPIFYSVVSGDTALSEAVTSGDIVLSQTIRRESRTEVKIPLFDFFFSTGTIQWLSYVAFAMAFTVKRARWWIVAAVLFAAMTYFSVVDASVSKILYYLIGILILRSLLGGVFIKWYEIAGILTLVEVMFVMFKGSDQGFIANVVGPVFERVFFGQMIGTYLSLEMFPYSHDFIGFSSTGRVIHEILGLPFSESYGLIMMGLYRPLAVERGYGGHLTTMFLGEAWANFGLWGVVLGPVWVGIFVQTVNLMFVRKPKNAVSLALYVYLSITFGYHSDLMGFYYPVGTIAFVVGCLTLVIVGRFIGGSTREASPRAMPVGN